MSRWNSTRKMWEYGEGGSVSFLGGGWCGFRLYSFSNDTQYNCLFVCNKRERTGCKGGAGGGGIHGCIFLKGGRESSGEGNTCGTAATAAAAGGATAFEFIHGSGWTWGRGQGKGIWQTRTLDMLWLAWRVCACALGRGEWGLLAS